MICLIWPSKESLQRLHLQSQPLWSAPSCPPGGFLNALLWSVQSDISYLMSERVSYILNTQALFFSGPTVSLVYTLAYSPGLWCPWCSLSDIQGWAWALPLPGPILMTWHVVWPCPSVMLFTKAHPSLSFQITTASSFISFYLSSLSGILLQ